MDKILILCVVILGLSHNAQSQSCTYLYATSSTQYLYSHTSYGVFNYINNYDACWIIQTTDSTKVVKLYRYNFDVESDSTSSCSFDKLTIYDASSAYGTTYVNLCGVNVITTLYSSGNYMYLRFTTDSSNTREGFKFSYTQASSSYYSSTQWSSSYYNYFTDVASTALSIATIIGIVFGVIVFLVVIGIIICVVCAIKSGNRRGRVTAVPMTTGTVVISQQQQQQPRMVQPSNQYGNNGMYNQGYANPAYGAYGGQYNNPQAYGMQPQPAYGAMPPPPAYQAPTDPSYPPTGSGVANISGGVNPAYPSSAPEKPPGMY